jgi:hypothetical protein
VESRRHRVEIGRTSRSHGKVLVGRALIAALGGSLTMATAGAIVGIMVLTAPPAPVNGATGPAEASSAPTPSVVQIQAADPRFLPTVGSAVTAAVTSLQAYAITPEAARGLAPFSTANMHAGFASSYTFHAQIAGLNDLSSLGATIDGTVIDPTHFTLDFPESKTISFYERTNDTARIVLGGSEINVHLGDSAGFGTVSPEDFLPERLWTLVADRWASTLTPGTVPGQFASDSAALTAMARKQGYPATAWTMDARLDIAGRLTRLHFSGKVSRLLDDGTPQDEQLALDIEVTYP